MCERRERERERGGNKKCSLNARWQRTQSWRRFYKNKWCGVRLELENWKCQLYASSRVCGVLSDESKDRCTRWQLAGTEVTHRYTVWEWWERSLSPLVKVALSFTSGLSVKPIFQEKKRESVCLIVAVCTYAAICRTDHPSILWDEWMTRASASCVLHFSLCILL